MTRHWIILVSAILTFTFAAAAHSQPRRTPAKRTATQPATQPGSTKPTDAAVPPAQAPPPADNSTTLAIVNDLTVTAADIESAVSASILNDPDPYLQAFYQDREKAIREARQRAVDARVNSLLISAEAKKRGITAEEFLEREVTSRVPAPTDAEVRAVYDANRAQLGPDIEAVRANIVNYLRG